MRSTIEYLGLYHFYPKSEIAYVVTSGCNLSCTFCPEYKTVHSMQMSMSPDEVYAKVLKFTEEFSLDIIGFYCNSILDIELIEKLKHVGRKIVALSHGFGTATSRNKLLSSLDAILVRFFGFSEETYSKLTSIPSGYKYALDTVKAAYKIGLHIETEFYIVPGITKENEFIRFVNAIKEINQSIPLHIRRFYPKFLEDKRSPTRTEDLIKFYKLAEGKLDYVYGDLWHSPMNNTFCPNGHLVIERFGWKVKRILLDGDRCSICGKKIPIIRF